MFITLGLVLLVIFLAWSGWKFDQRLRVAYLRAFQTSMISIEQTKQNGYRGHAWIISDALLVYVTN